MDYNSIIELAKDYTISSEEIPWPKESNRVEFVKRFPKDQIINLTIDEYVQGNNNNDSFCYWLEFKKIEGVRVSFGIGGGTSAKFGLYKSKKENEYIAGFDNKILEGDALNDFFKKLIKCILDAIRLVDENRIEEIKNLEIPFRAIVLQKILAIYYPDKFLHIGSPNIIMEIANALGIDNVEVSKKNQIEVNYECKKLLDKTDPFKDWGYEKMSKFLWDQFNPEEADSEEKIGIKYWIYAPGSNADMWDEFYDKGIIGLNWDSLGDISQYDSKDSIAKKLIEFNDNVGSKKNDATANYEFANIMSIGDIIFVKKGRGELLGYGIVDSDYFFDKTRLNYKSCRKVTWKLKGVWQADHTIVLKTLTDITKYSTDNKLYDKYYQHLFGIMGVLSGTNNYKNQFIEWLNQNNTNESGAKSSYLKALEKLSEKIKSDIFIKYDLFELNELYVDVKKEQKNKNSIYFDAQTPSYGNGGFYSAALSKYIEFIKQITTSKSTILNNNIMPASLNTILYGPPGTGKTYNSINKAISIINPDFLLSNDRIELRQEYKRLENNNQIIFTTFHQSMSYEDFVEGIKPLPPQPNESLKYEIQAGIFKIACARAAYLCHKQYNIDKGTISSNYRFDDLYAAFIDYLQSSIQNGVYPIYKTITGKSVEVFEINSQDSIRARAKGSQTIKAAPLTQDNIEKLYNKFKEVADIEDLGAVKEAVGVSPRITEFYAVFGGLKEFEKTFKPDLEIISESLNIDSIDDVEKLKKFSAGIYNEAIINSGATSEPVVLIIDEINRGNVSQIFGELITLIETDKRFGNSESLEVMLPYSKTKFFVPPNLYILGTMNTADRSVEALDTALRRRFTFEEMLPNYEIQGLQYSVFDFKASEILKVINRRIEKLLDKDHLIGHSYFMNTNSDELFIQSMYKNILPLLQEYFYGDFGKIGLVLGGGFVKKVTPDQKDDLFAAFDYDDINDFESKETYEIIDYRDNGSVKGSKADFKTAIKLLMNI
jgi:predicted Mrr-cat superfamily restriction endonuclease